MKKSVLFSMTGAERTLVADTERDVIADLSEDELLDLHTRIRRVRSKYVKNYRRAASARVGDVGARGEAFEQNSRDRDKAEIFELALARVSRQVGVRANQVAAQLKAERLAAARQGSAGPETSGTGESEKAPAGRARRASKTTGGIKRDASSRAAGARRQAKRDAN